MPCIDSSGQINEMARKLLDAFAEGSSLIATADKTGLPLYRVRSGARELAEAGLVEPANETYALTDAGRAAMAKVSGES